MNSIRRQIKSMLTVEPRAGGYRAIFKVAADLSILPDHFKGAPILPGMCLMQAVLLAAESSLELTELRLVTLKNAKLVGPIFPGDEVTIDADISTDDQDRMIIKAKVAGDGKRKAEISLIARQASPEAIPA